MSYVQFRSFLAVAKEGSISAAARALRLSQPTVTKQVQDLERRFGVELFVRRGRRVEPNATGRSLATLIDRFFSAEQEAVAFIESARNLGSGKLAVASVGPYYILGLLAAFHRRYPMVQSSVWTSNSNDVIAAVKEFRADIGFAAADQLDDDLYTIVRDYHPLVLVVGADHPWAERSEASLRELHGQNMVVRERGSYTRHAFEDRIRQLGDIQPNIAMEISDRETLREAVAEGIGVAVLRAQAYVPHHKLRVLKVSDSDIELSTVVFCLRERKDSAIVAAFRQVAKDLAER